MIRGHVFIATSLDGYIARLDGSIDWLLSRDSPTEDHGYTDFIRDMDGILMGRGSFEKALSFEPWPYDRPVVVLSKTLKDSDIPEALRGRVRILDRTPEGAMEQLENEGWKRVYVDGGQIVQSFLRAGLVESLVVTQIPVLIGEGRRLFGPLAKDLGLKHEGTQSFPSGLVQLRYRVLG